MPQRKTESRFLKHTGRRASSVGVGGRPYAEDMLRDVGVSARTISDFRRLIEARVPVDRAMELAIKQTDSKLYGRIEACADEDHVTFRSKMRRLLAIRRVRG